MVERNLAKVEVESSRLFSRSRFEEREAAASLFIRFAKAVQRRGSKAVMQRIANPSRPVRLRPAPPRICRTEKRPAMRGVLFYPTARGRIFSFRRSNGAPGSRPRNTRRSPARSARAPLALLRAQLHAADLAGDGLRQLARTRCGACACRAPAARARRRRSLAPASRIGSQPGGEDHERLGHREPHGIGARHHRRLGHRLVLDQRALQLERADAVVGRLEHVVGAADVGDVAVGVARAPRRRCGSSRRASRRRSAARSSW